jgi:GNAT superfamily N-acetyltransferase
MGRIISVTEEPNQANCIASWLRDEWGNMPIVEYLTSLKGEPPSDQPQGGLPIVFAYVRQGQAVGSVALLMDDMTIRPSLNPWLGCLYVLPIYRGQGIATKLFDHCERSARLRGISTLYLFTSQIRSFALKKGWQELEKVDFEGEEVSVMKKVL